MSPFEVAVAGDQARTEPRTKADLLALSRRAEQRGSRARQGELVLVTLQDARHWTPATESIYRKMAARGATVIVFAVGMVTDLTGPLEGRVATVGLAETDLLADEWLVIFCSETGRHGFVSRDVSAGLPGARSAPRVPPANDDLGRFGSERLFMWADLSDPVWLERAAAVLLTRVPSLAVMVPWLSI